MGYLTHLSYTADMVSLIFVFCEELETLYGMSYCESDH